MYFALEKKCMVAPAYNPSYVEGRERRIAIQDQPRKKLARLHLKTRTRHDGVCL
jgi:hypothetical protein